MYRLICLALCIIACHAASLPVGQQPSTSNSQDVYCEINSQKVKPGQRQAQGGFLYECQLTDTYLGVKIVACMDDNGGEHAFGERWVHGKAPFRFILECNKDAQGVTRRLVVQCFYDSTDGQAKIDPDSEQRVGPKTVKCLRREGAGLEYKVIYVQNDPAVSTNVNGASAGSSSGSSSSSGTSSSGSSTNSGSSSSSSGSNTNSASSSGSAVSAGFSSSNKQEPVCYVKNQELKAGQRASTSSFVYECQASDSSVRAVIVACLDDNKPQGEHPIGDRWVEGDNKPYRFVFECSKKGEITQKKPVQCFYDSDEGQAKLDAGAQQTVGKYVVSCATNGESGVRFNLAFTEAYLASFKNVTTGSKMI